MIMKRTTLLCHLLLLGFDSPLIAFWHGIESEKEADIVSIVSILSPEIIKEEKTLKHVNFNSASGTFK